MQTPEKPADESSRLQDLNDLDVLDTPISNSFESITRLAKAMSSEASLRPTSMLCH